jgi:hypothetical protein
MNRRAANGQPPGQEDDLRQGRWLTFWIAIIGMGVLIASVFAALVFRNADNPGELIAAVLGPVGTAVGTLAGFVAGAKVGSEGEDKAEGRADVAQKKYEAVVESAPADIVDQARQRYPDLFR